MRTRCFKSIAKNKLRVCRIIRRIVSGLCIYSLFFNNCAAAGIDISKAQVNAVTLSPSLLINLSTAQKNFKPISPELLEDERITAAYVRGKNFCFVSYLIWTLENLGGESPLDGVSQEIGIWAKMLQALGAEKITFWAGKTATQLPYVTAAKGQAAAHFNFDADKIIAFYQKMLEEGEIDQEKFEKIKEIVKEDGLTRLYRDVFRKKYISLGQQEELNIIKEILKKQLRKHIIDEKIDVLISTNTQAYAGNMSLADALFEIEKEVLNELSREFNIRIIKFGHDFFWERLKFSKYESKRLTRNLRNMITGTKYSRHVVINPDQLKELFDKYGIKGDIIVNCRDFHNPPKISESRIREFRKAFKIGEDDIVIAFPVRKIERKGLDSAIQIVRKVLKGLSDEEQKRVKVLFTHPGDDGERQYAEDIMTEFESILGKNRIIDVSDGKRWQKAKEFVLDEAYASSDLVLMMSRIEGYGNALVESWLHKLPVVVRRYPIYRKYIALLGFANIELNGQGEDDALAPDKNFKSVVIRTVEMIRSIERVKELKKLKQKLIALEQYSLRARALVETRDRIIKSLQLETTEVELTVESIISKLQKHEILGEVNWQPMVSEITLILRKNHQANMLGFLESELIEVLKKNSRLERRTLTGLTNVIRAEEDKKTIEETLNKSSRLELNRWRNSNISPELLNEIKSQFQYSGLSFETVSAEDIIDMINILIDEEWVTKMTKKNFELGKEHLSLKRLRKSFLAVMKKLYEPEEHENGKVVDAQEDSAEGFSQMMIPEIEKRNREFVESARNLLDVIYKGRYMETISAGQDIGNRFSRLLDERGYKLLWQSIGFWPAMELMDSSKMRAMITEHLQRKQFGFSAEEITLMVNLVLLRKNVWELGLGKISRGEFNESIEDAINTITQENMRTRFLNLLAVSSFIEVNVTGKLYGEKDKYLNIIRELMGAKETPDNIGELIRFHKVKGKPTIARMLEAALSNGKPVDKEMIFYMDYIMRLHKLKHQMELVEKLSVEAMDLYDRKMMLALESLFHVTEQTMAKEEFKLPMLKEIVNWARPYLLMCAEKNNFHVNRKSRIKKAFEEYFIQSPSTKRAARNRIIDIKRAMLQVSRVLNLSDTPQGKIESFPEKRRWIAEAIWKGGEMYREDDIDYALELNETLMPYNPNSTTYCAIKVRSIDELKELVFKGPVRPDSYMHKFFLCIRPNRVMTEVFEKRDERGDDFFYVVLQLDIEKIENRRGKGFFSFSDIKYLREIKPQEINKLIMFNQKTGKWEDVTVLANKEVIESFLPGNSRDVKELLQGQPIRRVFDKSHATAIESAI